VAGSSLGAPGAWAGRHLEHIVITVTAQSRPTVVSTTAVSPIALGTATVRTASTNVATANRRNSGPALVSVRDGLWRVVDRTGAVLGHIERQTHPDGERFLARRIVMATRRIDLGAFWRMEDAADCFR
jgi:hypothetical protein